MQIKIKGSKLKLIIKDSIFSKKNKIHRWTRNGVETNAVPTMSLLRNQSRKIPESINSFLAWSSCITLIILSTWNNFLCYRNYDFLLTGVKCNPIFYIITNSIFAYTELGVDHSHVNLYWICWLFNDSYQAQIFQILLLLII